MNYALTYGSAGDLIAELVPVRSARLVGQMLGITRPRVHQIERAALNKVRDRLVRLVGYRGLTTRSRMSEPKRKAPKIKPPRTTRVHPDLAGLHGNEYRRAWRAKMKRENDRAKLREMCK